MYIPNKELDVTREDEQPQTALTAITPPAIAQITSLKGVGAAVIAEAKKVIRAVEKVVVEFF